MPVRAYSEQNIIIKSQSPGFNGKSVHVDYDVICPKCGRAGARGGPTGTWLNVGQRYSDAGPCYHCRETIRWTIGCG